MPPGTPLAHLLRILLQPCPSIEGQRDRLPPETVLVGKHQRAKSTTQGTQRTLQMGSGEDRLRKGCI